MTPEPYFEEDLTAHDAVKSRQPQANQQQQPRHQIQSVNCFFNALVRKKPLDLRTSTNLNRCLNLFDLTALGVGSTLGLGLYVLAGQVAANKAGPGVVISFALAAIASTFSALCYAEFAGKVPKAGSAYAYSYITVGEFCAYLIGFNMILEYVIGASSVAKGFSGYLRLIWQQLFVTISSPSHAAATVNGSLAAATTLQETSSPTYASSIIDYLSCTFDWLAVVIVIVVTCFILFGVKESTQITTVFTAINLCVVCIVLVSSVGHLKLQNWRLAKTDVPENAGSGGFMPFGWSGVLAGSATCFFGFIGFDTIASSAEEAKNPKRTVPLAIILSLCISCFAYMTIAVIQTLIWPYYDQNNITILPYIFQQLQMPVTCWLVLVGAIAGLASSQLGGMYPLPRIIYSMAYDRVIYAYFAKLNSKKLPLRATIFGSIMVSALACLLDVEELADFVSIGTLLAYSLVAISVLILRYEFREESDSLRDQIVMPNNSNNNKVDTNHHHHLVSLDQQQKQKNGVDHKNNDLLVVSCSCYNNKDTTKHKVIETKIITKKAQVISSSIVPNKKTDKESKILVSIIISLTILLDVILYCIATILTTNKTLALITVLTIFALIVKFVLDLYKLPTDTSNELNFETPFVPFTPLFSIFVNTYLMLNLSYMTWIRFIAWIAVGLFIYFTYGVWHSRSTIVKTSIKQTLSTTTTMNFDKI